MTARESIVREANMAACHLEVLLASAQIPLNPNTCVGME